MGNKNSKRKKNEINATLSNSIESSPLDGIVFKQVDTNNSDPFHDNGDCNDSITACNPYQRIQETLKSYESWIAAQTLNKNDIVDEKFIDILRNDNNYSNTKLLDDYHHIIQYHDFNEIYDNLSCQCNVKPFECISLIRNHRKRLLSDNDKQIYYVKNTEFEEINCQQILDQIHSYIFHSYHCGYILNKNDLKQINDTKDTDIMSGHSAKIKKLKSVLQHYRNKNKCDSFMQSIPYDSKNDIDDRCKFEDLPIHDFGLRHFYWGGQSRGEIEGKPKYSTLKNELLSCNLFNFSLNEWNIIYIKATNHANKTYQNDTNIDYTTECTGITDGALMTIPHFLSILIYTNYRKIKYHFIKTYQRLYPEETKDEMAERHSIFCNFGKLLWEVVNVYGINQYSSKCKFIYFGMNENKLFVSTLGRFATAGPISVNRNIVSTLNMYKGIIIKIEHHDGIQFRSEFISDFSAEQEVLVMSRYENWFDFNSIIDIENGIDYERYLKAINIIRAMSKDYCGIQRTNVVNRKQIFDTVLSLFEYAANSMKYDDLKEYPIYIKKLWRLHLERTRLNINMKHINDYYSFIKTYLLEKNCFIKLDVLCDIFHNMKELDVEHCEINDKLFKYIHEYLLRKHKFLNNGKDYKFNYIISYYCRLYAICLGNDLYNLLFEYFKNVKLKKIILSELPASKEMNRNKLIKKWMKKYDDINWAITNGRDRIDIKLQETK